MKGSLGFDLTNVWTSFPPTLNDFQPQRTYTMKHILSLFVTTLFIAHVSGQTPSAVEAAEHDPVNDRWLVSNGNSVLYTEDLGNSWSTLGSASASYGMEVIGTTLFTIHNNAIKAYDVTTGTPLGTHNPGNVSFLNGMGSQSDEDGDVWWSAIFGRKPRSRRRPRQHEFECVGRQHGQHAQWGDPEGRRGHCGQLGSNADILQVDVATGAMTTLIDGTGLGNRDGVDWAETVRGALCHPTGSPCSFLRRTFQASGPKKH